MSELTSVVQAPSHYLNDWLSVGLLWTSLVKFEYEYTNILIQRIHLNMSPVKWLILIIMWRVGWNFLSISKLQRLHRWILRMDKLFHPTLYSGCNYLFKLGLRSIHVIKQIPRFNATINLSQHQDSGDSADEKLTNMVFWLFDISFPTDKWIVYTTYFIDLYSSASGDGHMRSIAYLPIKAMMKSHYLSKDYTYIDHWVKMKFNSLRPSDTYMLQWHGLSLVQMACHYLTQRWLFVNWTIKKLPPKQKQNKTKQKQNTNILYQENDFDNAACNMVVRFCLGLDMLAMPRTTSTIFQIL